MKMNLEQFKQLTASEFLDWMDELTDEEYTEFQTQLHDSGPVSTAGLEALEYSKNAVRVYMGSLGAVAAAAGAGPAGALIAAVGEGFAQMFGAMYDHNAKARAEAIHQQIKQSIAKARELLDQRNKPEWIAMNRAAGIDAAKQHTTTEAQQAAAGVAGPFVPVPALAWDSQTWLVQIDGTQRSVTAAQAALEALQAQADFLANKLSTCHRGVAAAKAGADAKAASLRAAVRTATTSGVPLIVAEAKAAAEQAAADLRQMEAAQRLTFDEWSRAAGEPGTLITHRGEMMTGTFMGAQ